MAERFLPESNSKSRIECFNKDTLAIISRILTQNEEILRQNGILLEHLSKPLIVLDTDWAKIDMSKIVK